MYILQSFMEQVCTSNGIRKVMRLLQANSSKIWLQQQHTSALQMLVSKTDALQQIFLDMAASEAAANAAVSSDEPANDDGLEQQDQQETEAEQDPQEAEGESQPRDETQQDGGAENEEEQGEGESEIEEEPYSPKPAWSVAAVSFRGVLRALQDKGVFGEKVTAEQALTALHQACYEGCPPDQLLTHAG